MTKNEKLADEFAQQAIRALEAQSIQRAGIKSIILGAPPKSKLADRSWPFTYFDHPYKPWTIDDGDDFGAYADWPDTLTVEMTAYVCNLIQDAVARYPDYVAVPVARGDKLPDGQVLKVGIEVRIQPFKHDEAELMTQLSFAVSRQTAKAA